MPLLTIQNFFTLICFIATQSAVLIMTIILAVRRAIVVVRRILTVLVVTSHTTKECYISSVCGRVRKLYILIILFTCRVSALTFAHNNSLIIDSLESIICGCNADTKLRLKDLSFQSYTIRRCLCNRYRLCASFTTFASDKEKFKKGAN